MENNINLHPNTEQREAKEETVKDYIEKLKDLPANEKMKKAIEKKAQELKDNKLIIK